MDYFNQLHYLDQKFREQQGMLAFEEWRLAPEKPEKPQPAPTCGQCRHYQAPRTLKGKKLWGFCTLRAAAELHPCNLPPWDKYAGECSYFDAEEEF